MIDYNCLRDDLNWLRAEDGVIQESQAISVLSRVLTPLFATENLKLFIPEKQGLTSDLIAASPNNKDSDPVSVAIEYKHRGEGRPIGLDAVTQLQSYVTATPFKRAMLIGRFGFTNEAIVEATRFKPISVDLFDLNRIEEWINRLELGNSSTVRQFQLIIRTISHEFAKRVADDPNFLNEIEWRDLERMIARVMEGLGFTTTLTPPSKDGGKDLILICETIRGEESFIVELKHWRSGKRVGQKLVSNFLHVIVSEHRTGGLLLSTSGYSKNSYEGLTQFDRQQIRLGDDKKIVLLAQTYMRAYNGIWSQPSSLPDILFQSTF
jgi:hypothetical protein